MDSDKLQKKFQDALQNQDMDSAKIFMDLLNEEVKTTTSLPLPDGFHATDSGRANRFVAHVSGKARYVPEWSSWVVYREDLGHWSKDVGNVFVTEMFRDMSARLLKDTEDNQEYNEDQRDVLIKQVAVCEQTRIIRDALHQARGVPGVVIDYQEFDHDRYTFNVENGTIDLRSGEMRAHNHEDLLMKQAPVRFEPETPCPNFSAFLDMFVPDMDKRDYIQRVAGAALTGDPTQAAFVNVGTGGNGKSVFFGTLRKIMGGYACEVDKSLLVTSKHDAHQTVIAELYRVRLALASETESGARINEASLKTLTGGDELRGRHMREDRWSFSPSHSLVMHTNYAPKVRGTDDGIWRRLRMITWDHKLPAGVKKVEDYATQLYETEASGILNWFLEGARKYLERGLEEPECVTQATREYRESEDILGRFLTDRTLAGGECSATDFRREFEDWWAEEEGAHSTPWSQKSLAPLLREKGFEQQKRRNGMYWLGFKLIPSGYVGMDDALGDILDFSED